MGHIYPIGGGKGGSGKSFLTTSLGVLFAKRGSRVVLMDLDLGSSNLHTFLGLKKPKIGLNDFLEKKLPKLAQAVESTPIPNLSVISSINCSMEIANLNHAQKSKIIKALQKLPADYVFLDLGAGTHFNTLDFFLASKEGLCVLTPEPTSIENSFRFIKAVYWRGLKQILKQQDFKKIAKELNEHIKNAGIRSPSDIIEFVSRRYPEKGNLLERKLSEFRFRFVLNQFRKQSDAMLGQKIEKVCNRHFYSRFQFLGNISYDEKVHDSIYCNELFIVKYPYTLTAVDLNRVAEKMRDGGQKSISVTSRSQ